MSNQNERWTDYYMARNKNSKNSWVLEIVDSIRNFVPSFEDVFDKVPFCSRSRVWGNKIGRIDLISWIPGQPGSVS